MSVGRHASSVVTIAMHRQWSPLPCIVGGLLCIVGGSLCAAGGLLCAVGGSLCVVGGSPRISEKWENGGDTYKDAQPVLLGRVAEEARQ